MADTRLNDKVRDFWEQEACGTSDFIVGEAVEGSREWFDRVEEHRYRVEPFIHSVAQFTRHHGKKILEVGVGAGTDHLQWARAGCRCYGVDLTDTAISTTRARLALYGFTSELQRINAEALPFPDGSFDLVYSWGVIHHSEKPERIVEEIHRVLRPGGTFIGMIYGRRSMLAFKAWVRYALLTGRPWRSFSDVLWHHVESVGTKAYTRKEASAMFSPFAHVTVAPLMTTYDTALWPKCISRFFPADWGWFLAIEAKK